MATCGCLIPQRALTEKASTAQPRCEAFLRQVTPGGFKNGTPCYYGVHTIVENRQSAIAGAGFHPNQFSPAGGRGNAAPFDSELPGWDFVNRWFAEHDPEGVAFRYDVISEPV